MWLFVKRCQRAMICDNFCCAPVQIRAKLFNSQYYCQQLLFVCGIVTFRPSQLVTQIVYWLQSMTLVLLEDSAYSHIRGISF